MRTIRTKVYQFSELSEQAKQKAIEWYKKGLWEDENILFGFEDYCQDRAKEIGFNDIKIRYSLSYCQGDGLSFTCTDFNLNHKKHKHNDTDTKNYHV